MEPTTSSSGELQPKTHLTGKVIKTTLAGAIVDVGEKVPGVVHISQLRAEAVNRVEDVVQVGQTVEVWVRRVREDRIELTMIEPLQLEWREIKADMLVKGKVTRLEQYGAFIDIGAERAGLVHVSEISHDYIKSPAEVLKVGDEVEAKVLDVDRRKKQIRLSIKAALPKPEEILAEVKAAEPKPARTKKSKKEPEAAEPEQKEPELTSMEIAYRQAMERSKGSRKSGPVKPTKAKTTITQEQEEIFNRTLENRITSK